MNASVASGVPAAEYGALADTVTLCFSKGLGCPLGAILAGSRETMGKAWRCKFLFGGAMRQAGIVAAAALYALDNNVERLAEDHARAKRLAEGLAEAGLPVDPTGSRHELRRDSRPSRSDSRSRRRPSESRPKASSPGGLRPGVVRLATYLGVEDERHRRRPIGRSPARSAVRAAASRRLRIAGEEERERRQAVARR